MSAERFFLSKKGQVSGPFTSEQIKQLNTAGELNSYHWLWSNSIDRWMAIDDYFNVSGQNEYAEAPTPVPKLVPAAASAPEPVLTSTAVPASVPPVATGSVPESAPEPKPIPIRKSEITSPQFNENSVDYQFKALCHNHKEIMSGVVSSISKNSCVLVDNSKRAGIPKFKKGSQVVLNLLDSASMQSENVPAMIKEINKQNGSWAYLLVWKQSPKIVNIP